MFFVIKESVTSWSRGDAPLHAAALAFYTIFSLAPLVIISVGIAGLVFSQSMVEGAVVYLMDDLVGLEAAQVIEEILVASNNITTSGLAALIGMLVMIWGASIVFTRLQQSLNVMWNIQPNSANVQSSVIATVKGRLMSTLAALSVGVIILLTLVINTIWVTLPKQFVGKFIPEATSWLLPLLSLVANPLVYALIFAAIFKALPQATVRWRDVWPGATITAILFWIGTIVITFFLGRSWLISAYGAGSSLIIFLIWVYYSTWIILFGAKFILVYAANFGTPIVPDRNMIFRNDTN